MKLSLTFVYRENGRSRLVMTQAKPPFPGSPLYQDNKFLYTEEGKFEKKNISGRVEEELIWEDEEA